MKPIVEIYKAFVWDIDLFRNGTGHLPSRLLQVIEQEIYRKTLSHLKIKPNNQIEITETKILKKQLFFQERGEGNVTGEMDATRGLSWWHLHGKGKRSFLDDPISFWCLCYLLLVQLSFLGGIEYNLSMVELVFLFMVK